MTNPIALRRGMKVTMAADLTERWQWRTKTQPYQAEASGATGSGSESGQAL